MEKKSNNPRFKIGEKVITDLFHREGVIKSITERSDDWVYKYKYLVEFIDKGWFGKESKYTEWILEPTLNKFIN